jgi:hypothetical protein
VEGIIITLLRFIVTSLLCGVMTTFASPKGRHAPALAFPADNETVCSWRRRRFLPAALDNARVL